MKNWERYEKEIKALGINSFAITKDGEVNRCLVVNCNDCRFQVKKRKCNEEMINWLYKECEKPKVDWSKVPVDTPIYVRGEEGEKWRPRHFAGVDKYGKVLAWANGRTSFSQTMENTCPWEYAELAEGFNERD